MFEFKENIAIDQFNKFASEHELSSINQSIYWPKVKNNWKPYYTGLYQDGNLVAVALVLIRKVLGFKFAYVPRGPLMDYENQAIVNAMMDGLKQLSKKLNSLFVRMDPKVVYKEYPLNDKEHRPILKSGQIAVDNLIKAGTKHLGFPIHIHDGFQPRFVAVTYYSDTFMEDLPKRTLKSIKDADKRNVTVRRGNRDDVAKFVEVLGMTEDRKHIQLRSQEYFEMMLDTFGDKALLMLAEVDLDRNMREYQAELDELLEILPEKPPKKAAQLQQRIDSLHGLIAEIEPYIKQGIHHKVLSAGLTILYGNTAEHIYSGFDINFKKYRPQYKLTVARMKYGFEHGYKYSNLGGIEGTLSDGLTEFKSNFNPMINEYIGEFDIPTSPLYPLFRLAWNIREKMRGRKG